MQEEETLEAGWERGWTLKELAERHGRTVSAVRHRLVDRGLIDGEGEPIAFEDRYSSVLMPLPATTQGVGAGIDNAQDDSLPLPVSNQGKPWTMAGDASIADKWRKGVPVKVIATRHKRTVQDVTHRLRRLGLID